jgi:putative SOS response-associated peptidase YedK
MCFSIQVDKDIKKLAEQFRAKPVTSEFQALQEMKALSSKIKIPSEDGIVYPNYFAPVIVSQKNERYIRPMRYRVRPNNSASEIPSKYNVFNARVDSLEKRETWSNIFMKNHGLIAFKKFYEWVEDNEGKKHLIYFEPKERQTMWAPCLWDHWSAPDKSLEFFSFAIITTEPPEEVLNAGHDRCPIFLKEDQIETWLNPKNIDRKSIYESLGMQESVYYEHARV